MRRVGQVRHHRLEVREQRRQHGDRLVQVDAAAGEPVAEARAASALALARLLVERVEDLVDLDRLGRAPARAGSARRPRSRRSALPGVISTYLRPSAERERTISVESSGSGSTFFWSFIETSADACRRAGGPASISSTTPTRKPPIRTSLPTHEVRGVRQLGLEVVGGHERQAAVRVVGEEHGDDHHEHGERADQHRAARDRCLAAAPAHPSSPAGSRAPAPRALVLLVEVGDRPRSAPRRIAVERVPRAGGGSSGRSAGAAPPRATPGRSVLSPDSLSSTDLPSPSYRRMPRPSAWRSFDAAPGRACRAAARRDRARGGEVGVAAGDRARPRRTSRGW